MLEGNIGCQILGGSAPPPTNSKYWVGGGGGVQPPGTPPAHRLLRPWFVYTRAPSHARTGISLKVASSFKKVKQNTWGLCLKIPVTSHTLLASNCLKLYAVSLFSDGGVRTYIYNPPPPPTIYRLDYNGGEAFANYNWINCAYLCIPNSHYSLMRTCAGVTVGAIM